MLEQLFQQDNWLAVLVSTAAYFIFGAIWYGSLGKQWMAAANLTREKIATGPKLLYLYTFIIEFIVVMAMSALLHGLGITEVGDAIQFGLVVGLILGTMTTWIHYLYSMQKSSLYFIDGGYITIASVLAAIILCVM